MPPPAIRALPNAITLFRLVAAAAFFLIVAVALSRLEDPNRQLWGNIAFAIFIVAALSDLLDGWLARRWHAVSVFGRIMDPFCDKVLVLGAFVLLAGPSFARVVDDGHGLIPRSDSGVEPWMVVVILARELLVTSLRGVLESKGVDFSADRAGKWKMLLQSICVPTCLFVACNLFALESTGWVVFRDIVVWLTVGVTVWSVVPYVVRARVLLQQAERDATR
ncbi:MAG: CDP-alcohol phosphatidyltransferase family protein [Phycisphaerales bacterium]